MRRRGRPVCSDAAECVVREGGAEIFTNGNRVVDQLLRRALRDDLAVLDEVAPVGDLEHLADVMVGEQDADPLHRQLANVAANVLGGLGIDGRERFVEQNQERLARQAPGNLEPALLAAGAARRRVLADVLELKTLQHRVRAFPAFASREPPAKQTAARQCFQYGDEVLLDGQLAKNALLLRQIAHAEPGPSEHGQPGNILAVEDDLAVVGHDLPGRHAETCRFAGPIRTEQADNFARVDIVRDAVNDPAFAVDFHQPACFQQGHTRSFGRIFTL